jgi:hypothetical protein
MSIFRHSLEKQTIRLLAKTSWLYCAVQEPAATLAQHEAREELNVLETGFIITRSNST